MVVVGDQVFVDLKRNIDHVIFWQLLKSFNLRVFILWNLNLYDEINDCFDLWILLKVYLKIF